MSLQAILLELYELELAKVLADLSEQDTKRVGGRTHERGDFLVVEDTEKTSTWHLPVKVRGTPNRRLAGAAWAALFDPDGYRGNRYEGPKAAEAKRKLRALYRSEDWEMPEESSEAETGEMSEMDEYVQVPVSSGPTSFADLIASEEAQEAARQVHHYTYQFQTLAFNILSDSGIENKVNALAELAGEFIQLVGEAMGQARSEESAVLPGELAEVDLEENAGGHAIKLVEAAAGNGSGPLILEVAVIEPGWGNKRDAHYYPAEMLEKHAGVFSGVKMYATDHRPEERSVRTEVSEILECPAGFTESGAPIAKVGVFDETFAQNVRNRDRLGTLNNLHCSILASGMAKEGEVDGKKGKIVESITEAYSVDWVTRAGAGGHALRIAESEVNMPNDHEIQEQAPREEAPEEEVQAAEAQPVTIEESDQDAETEVEEQEPEQEATALSEAEIKAILAESNLPAVAKNRMAQARFENEEAVREAITREIAYLKEVTGSGKPFAQGTSSEPEPAQMSEAERTEAFNEIMRHVGAREV